MPAEPTALKAEDVLANAHWLRALADEARPSIAPAEIVGEFNLNVGETKQLSFDGAWK